jgi:RNA polymerase sigma factor (sigma-70 family)
MVDHTVLVREIVQGDREKFRVLITEFQRLVSHVVFRMVPDPHDREDICQEVFLKVYQNLAGFRHESKLSTWIAQIARNTCVSFNGRMHLPVQDQFTDSDEAPFSLSGAAEELSRPDRLFEVAEMSATIVQEIDRLPALPGTVLTLFHLEQMTIQEIGQIMQIPENTVKSHLFRARRLLKDRLAHHFRWEQT